MQIKRIVTGILEENGYIIYQKNSEDCFIIDPGADADRFVSFVEENGLRPSAVLLTHGHHDHCGGVDRLTDRAPCPVYIHREDEDLAKCRTDEYLEDGQVFKLGDEDIKVIHTPGHTRGGVCFYAEKSRAVFTGDTIFDIDIGRMDLEGGSEKDMAQSLKNVVDKWENDMIIYPGHGGSSSMKKVRQVNSEFLDMIGE
ncbi:MAG: MBL fold metallo-hydrolase [Bacillota bacterium]|nr:MBL fold metallo-hydrolase [Bacillota bacterium]